MKVLIGLASSLALVSVLPAQTVPTKLMTALNVSVVANDGATTIKTIKKGTAITHKASVWAKRHKASARTDVSLENKVGRHSSRSATHRVSIREDGWAHGKLSKDAFFAHTSHDAKGGKAGTHDFVWTAAAKKGTKGKVEVRWHGKTMGAARITASVDLNGDRKPEWTGGATRGTMTKTFAVVAGARGFAFHLQTFGHAGIKGRSRSSYKGHLTVSFTAAGSTQPPKVVCTTSTFGKACGPTMTGTVKTSNGRSYLEMISTKIPLRSFGLHVIGTRLTSKPIALPGSKCTLIVAPRHFFFVRQGKGGTALVRIPFRPKDGLTVLNQQIWLTFGSKGMTSSSTNGIKLTCKKSGS